MIIITVIVIFVLNALTKKYPYVTLPLFFFQTN